MSEVILRYLHRQYGSPEPDGQLLARYAATGHMAAFEQLVERHGPMVLRLCRRKVGEADADDVFQAVFILLSRRAKSIHNPQTLAGWLHGTAMRVCQRALRSRSRRVKHEARANVQAVPQPLMELTARELLDALDEEIAKLPERERSPLLLVYWQGRTQERAARDLGLTPGALLGRLDRGRKRLGERLRTRGHMDGELLALLAAPLGSLTVSAELLANTVSLSVNGTVIPSTVAALTTAGTLAKWLPLSALALVITGVGALNLAGAGERKEKPTAKSVQANILTTPGAVVDQLGDALPTGALMRFGSARFIHPDSPSGLALSSDGKIGATTGNHLRIWNAVTGKTLHAYPKHNMSVRFYSGRHQLAFAPDGRLISTEHKTPFTRVPLVTDPVTGKQFEIPLDQPADVVSVDVSPDGQLLAFGTDKGVLILSIDTWQVVQRFPNRLTRDPRFDFKDAFSLLGLNYSLAVFAADGQSVAVFTTDSPRAVRLCHPRTGVEHQSIELSDRLSRMAISRDGKSLATVEYGNLIRVYETANGRVIRSWPTPPSLPNPSFGFAIAFGPDNKTLAIGNADNAIQLRDLAADGEPRILRGHNWHVNSLAYSPDGKTLFSASSDSTIRRWDLLNHREVPRAPQTGGWGTAAPSPVGSIVASEGHNGAIHLWKDPYHEPLQSLQGVAGPLAFMRFLT